MLKIKTSKGYLDLTSDLSIEVDEQSPVMNERASQSLPATVPATPRNLLITGFAHRIDGSTEPMSTDKTCVVSDGVYHRTGVLNLTSAHRKDGITFNVGFDNSEAYSTWQSKKMNELDLPVVGTGSVDDLCSEMASLYKGATGKDYTVFTVLASNGSKEVDDVTTYYPELLNEASDGTLVTEARTMQVILDSNVVNVSVPQGYGVTPFLYVWRVLELVFDALGYEIESNPFAQDADLARVVILNNVADSICTGYLNYSDLMPDCEVQAFLNALYVRFGMVYQLNIDAKTVKVELIRDIIAKTPATDLVQKISEWPTVNYETHKQLKLTAQTTFDGAAPKDERLEDFVKGTGLSSATTVDVLTERNVTTPLIYERSTGKLYRYDKTNQTYTDSVSGFFNWDPQTGDLESEELSSDDECVPMVDVDGTLYPGYLAGCLSHHTQINGYDGADTGDSTPLSFLIAGGVGGEMMGLLTPAPPHYGSSAVGSLSLLFQYGDGLFAQFWADYDAIMRHAFLKVEVPLRLTAHEILQMDMLTPVKFQGQPMLIDTYRYQLPMDAKTEVELTMRTIRIAGDYDLEAEQNIPVMGSTTKTWKWQHNGTDLAYQLQEGEKTARTMSGYTMIRSVTLISEPTGTLWQDDGYWLANPPQGNSGGLAKRSYTENAVYRVYNTDGNFTDITVPITYTVWMTAVLT